MRCPLRANKRHGGAATCNASATNAGKSTDEFRVNCDGLDLPSIGYLISDQGLRQEFLRGHESDVTNEADRSTHIIGDDYRPCHLRSIAACVC
jgi:hypothetical protein